MTYGTSVAASIAAASWALVDSLKKLKFRCVIALVCVCVCVCACVCVCDGVCVCVQIHRCLVFHWQVRQILDLHMQFFEEIHNLHGNMGSG